MPNPDETCMTDKHDHSHHDHAHHHHVHAASGARLRIALVLTLGFAVVEVLTGFWSGSLALLGDAGHMVTDALALGLAAFASWLAQRPPSHRHSYGLGRAEVIAALLNALLMLAVVTGIAIEAIARLQDPTPVKGGAVMAVAALGLLINILVAYILSRGEANLNVRAALLHVMGDVLGSVAALAAGAVIYFTGWMPIDPILALVVSVLILYSTVHLLRESLHVMMEGVPHHLELPDVGQAMARVDGVSSVHDLHIWTLSSGHIALSAHAVIRDMQDWDAVLLRLREQLEHDYAISHITVQPEVNEHVLQPMSYPPESRPSTRTRGLVENTGH